MSARTIPLIAFAAALAACGTADAPTALPLGSEAGLAKGGGGGGGSVLYQARFVVLSTLEGEITSDWFPPQGMSISTSNPWKGITLSGVTIDLNNFTHGDATWGTCGSFTHSVTPHPANWDIDGDPNRSYAGKWNGSVTIKSGYLAFDGDRVVEGVTPSAGGIHNMVTQQNVAVQTKDPVGNNDWFRQEVRNAALKFSGVSTPDGFPTPEYELACVNFTIELRKTTLIP
jgi:hypothetical protein